jgi:sugar/nucleoside kinase (ribokinase family)
LLLGADLEAALRFANACGAICTTAVGACTAIKSRDQVANFVSNSESSLTI